MPDLPSGTVTFLFTDIEGSTALWERDRQAMATAVERHIALLDAAIQAHGGIHFKTVGDAVQAAFPTAPDAVIAAVDAQRALVAEEWGDLGSLRVRMALHAGEAAPHDRDYLAAPLNRVSRLLATGHGGQILLTHVVQQLVRGELPPHTSLQDLGEHRLRDLLEPERVFQLLHPDLPDQFPPLKSLENRPNNLPRQPTPFLGREREVAEVVALLRRPDVQLLTLIGPGGTGKTRLGLQVAAEVLDDFPDGVFFVPLAPLSDPDLVPSAIASALGIREDREEALANRLREVLAPQQVLVVLDNVEHLVDAAPLVGDLLSATPGLKVLATSRVPLQLRAEREYPVPPLGLPRRKPPPTLEQLSQYEAVQLFIDRAQAVKPDFAIDNTSAPAVAEICWRLDGLPLAIELAAARVRMLPPETLLARLEKRLPLLTGGARDAPVRQRTLRDAIAWSYDLLDPEEQTLFRRLAVFAGGCTLEAGEAVGNYDGALDVIDGVEQLGEQSLLRQDAGPGDEPRFVMLETIREYGLGQLEANGEAEAVRQRHAAFYLDLVERAEPELIRPEQPMWLDRLEAEHDNVRAALRWALDKDVETALRLAAGLREFWLFRGHLTEGRAWLDRALVVGSRPGPLHVGVFAGAGLLAGHAGDYPRATTMQETSLALARVFQDRRGEALALLELGILAAFTGDSAQSIAKTEESLVLWRDLGDARGTSMALNNLGYDAYRQEDFERAASLLNEALVVARIAGERMLLGDTLDSLGALAEAQEDLVQAAVFYREALALGQEMGNPFTVATALRALGGVAARAHRAEDAARLWGAAAGLQEAIGAPLPPEEKERHEQALTTTRKLLGEEMFAATWQAGESSPIEEAVTEALALADALTQR